MLFYEERLGRIVGELKDLTLGECAPVTEYRYLQDGPGYFDDVKHLDTSAWQPFDKSCTWGGHNVYAWFDVTVQIPETMAGKCVLFALRIDEGWDATNTQFTVYVDGEIRQGFDTNHRDVMLTESAVPGETHRITLRAFSGRDKYEMRMAGRLQVLNREVEKYYYDLKVPLDVARLLPRDSEDYFAIIQSLTDSINLLDMRRVDSDAFWESLKAAQENLTREFYQKRCGDKPQKLYCVGHTHIDVAWWWTVAVSRDKSVRSFSTVLENMDMYPEFVFMSSQPQLYKFVKEDAPEVYQRIKERIADGRWEAEGAMFLEADCNLTSGESLVRQILYGKRFFRSEFGKDNKILWLPDVFGYSAALPQILKKSGVDYFMTTKISWNEINKMPYDTFNWEGIDGTRILTHFSVGRDYHMDDERRSKPSTPQITNTTYNAYLNARNIMGAWQRYQQKDINSEALVTFGFGDGGGGPTKDMIENQRRLALGIPGCPQTVMSDGYSFFQTLDEHTKGNRFLPAWVGELYLEYHRGTYTGMARNKRYNRKMEFAHQNAELYNTLSSKLTGSAYPLETIDAGWEVICRNQFHDILPGSSIKEVYDDSLAEYQAIEKESSQMILSAQQQVAAHVNAPAGSLVVFNPDSFENNDPVFFDLNGIISPVVFDGKKALPTQITFDGRGVFCLGAVPQKGYKTFTVREGAAVSATIAANPNSVETPYYSLRLNNKAQFTSILDKRAGRELLKNGERGNVIMTYEDKPHNYDAWDVNNYYTEKFWEMDDVQSCAVIESGVVRTVLRVVRQYLGSTFTQDIVLYENSPRIDFINDVDWHEQHIFVKALFPVDIHTAEATYEIQYGHVKRPTHYNTSWDVARFEVCHHKWLDVAENGYGVSLLNDCKYGAHVHDGVIGLSLLKCATLPNPDADKERHAFTYALLPHSGDWREAGTLKNAYALNNPLAAVFKANAAGALPAAFSAVTSDSENVVVEVVKQAEDSAAIILRVYEAYGRRTQATLALGFDAVSAAECDMMEENDVPVALNGASIALELRPFEIKTFKVLL